jgi:excisionase family DNA binding protein
MMKKAKGLRMKSALNEKIEELVSIKEVAKYLDVEITTVYTWVHTRQIPFYKIGRLVKFRLSEVERFIEGKKVMTKN